MALHYISESEEVAKLQEILEETANARLFWKEYHTGKTKEPGIWVVKDKGAYLMSAACSEKKVDHSKTKPKFPVVAYFNGFGPDVPFERQQKAWGGDDFCLLLPLSEKVLPAIREGRQVTVARIRIVVRRGLLMEASIGFKF